MQQEELEQKHKELKSFNLIFHEEQEKRMQAESALLSEGKEHAQSQEEVQRLTIEIQMANEKLNKLKQTKVDLENAVCELKKKVESLTDQNRSSELLIQELRNEINSLQDLKNEFQSETQSLRDTISQLNTEKDLKKLSRRSIKKLNELENEKLDLENTSRELKSTILDLNSEKDEALLQQQQSLSKVSDLELQLSKTQLELGNSEQKMQLLELETVQRSERVDSLMLSLKDEAEKRMQAETSLMSMENMYSQSQEEVNRLHLEIEKLNCIP
ncbi:hypothetical protein ABZP36_026956 [Zizania latifolia]